MKVDDISHRIMEIGNPVTSGNKNVEGENRLASGIEKEAQSRAAKVDFSNTSVEFSRAAEKMNEVSEERAEKIKDLKMKIENDTYNVDSEKIAEKIINESLVDIVEP